MDDTPLIIKIVQKLHNSGETVYIALGKLHYYLQKITDERDDPLFGGHNWKLLFVCPGINTTVKRFNELNADRWTIMKRDNTGELEWEMQEDRGVNEDLDDDYREPILVTILRQRMKKGEQVLYKSVDDFGDGGRVKVVELKSIERTSEGTKDAATYFKFAHRKTGNPLGLTIPDSLIHLWDIRGDATQWEFYRIEDARSESSRSKRVKEDLDKDPLIFTQALKLYVQSRRVGDAMFFYDVEDMDEPARLGDVYKHQGGEDYVFSTRRGESMQTRIYDRDHLENNMTISKHKGYWMVRYDPDPVEELEEEVDEDDDRIPLVAKLLLQLYNKGWQIKIEMGFHGFMGDITRIEEKPDGLDIAYESTTQGWKPSQKFGFRGMDYCFTLVKRGGGWYFTYTPEFLADLEKQRSEKR